MLRGQPGWFEGYLTVLAILMSTGQSFASLKDCLELIDIRCCHVRCGYVAAAAARLPLPQ